MGHKGELLGGGGVGRKVNSVPGGEEVVEAEEELSVAFKES